jgi:hypothetical protein
MAGSSMMRVWILGALFAVWSGVAWAEGCPKDRTPLEMAGHLLCLPTDAMPLIQRNESGDINGLVWQYPNKLRLDIPPPNGTVYIIIENTNFDIPPETAMQDHNLPELWMIASGRYTTIYPKKSRLWGEMYQIQCNAALDPMRNEHGWHDCTIKARVSSGISGRIFIATGEINNSSAWPEFDKKWVETWPTYLESIEATITNLLSIQ